MHETFSQDPDDYVDDTPDQYDRWQYLEDTGQDVLYTHTPKDSPYHKQSPHVDPHNCMECDTDYDDLLTYPEDDHYE